MGSPQTTQIPDIYITRIYNPDDPDCDVHCESFSRLAQVFGRNTPAHRHSRFFQVHLLQRGSIRLQLDDRFHAGHAPLVFLTPPAAPHAFYADDETEGLVVTVRQEVVRTWYAAMPGQWPQELLREPAFVTLAGSKSGEEGRRLMEFGRLLQHEFRASHAGRSAALGALGLNFFISLSRLIATHADTVPADRRSSEDLRLFLAFCDLVEAHFREHLTLRHYARLLKVTEARLNDICRRVACIASKELVHERVLAEARRLLRFSMTPVAELGYQLGFSDPGYFSRFFKQRTGRSPSDFRLHHQPKA